jgi:hypothetical protein
MLCDFSNGLMSVRERFHEEILIVFNQGQLHVFVGMNGLPSCRDETHDLIGVPSMDDSPMKEFGIVFPLLEPLDVRFLFPKNLFLSFPCF